MGIATLSTPFIVTQRKELSPAELLMMVCMFALLVAGPFYYYGMPFAGGRYAPALVGTQSWEEMIAFLLAAVYGLVALGVWAAISAGSSTLRDRAIDMNPTAPDGTELMVIRSPGDEASLALALGDSIEKVNSVFRWFLDFLTVRAAEKVLRVAMLLEPKLDAILAFAMLSVLPPLVYAIWAAETQAKIDHGVLNLMLAPIYIVLSPLFLAGAVMVLALIFGVVSKVGTAVASLGYGFEYALLGWGAGTTCETSPINSTVKVRSIQAADTALLSHGVYHFHETREALADWIWDTLSNSLGARARPTAVDDPDGGYAGY
jgi:hypothetical protein